MASASPRTNRTGCLPEVASTGVPRARAGLVQAGRPRARGIARAERKRWAPWCGPCPAISRALEEINSEREGLRLVKLDIDDNLPLPLGVAGHEGSTILVALNGLRLLRRSEWTAGRGQLMRDSEATRQ